MALVDYWLYRHERSDGPSEWQLFPLVSAETAILAAREAALVLQRARPPQTQRGVVDPVRLKILVPEPRVDPIDPRHVAVKRLELSRRWCVQHEEGWCATKNAPPRVVTGSSIRTLCKYWVNDAEHVALRLPTCRLCLTLLSKRIEGS